MNWMKYKLLYLTISLVFISSGLYSLFKWGLSLSIDFTGGVKAVYKLENGEILNIKEGIKTIQEVDKIRNEYKSKGAIEEVFEVVGPSIGPELIKKTYYAVGISTVLILLWITVQFRSVKFGISAVLAMLHDMLVLIGSFSLFGHFLNAEIDFLFVTAVLTTLSFSVHDTIVVFDRIREKLKLSSTENLELIANQAITETMVRSVNNSLTIIFMLLSLILLGGETIKWFGLALLIGTVSGTYSSPFVAIPFLVTWEYIQKKYVSLRTK